ncbi:MAG: hypothetical protein RLZZ502_707 [Pseudomonadota bacterium]
MKFYRPQSLQKPQHRELRLQQLLAWLCLGLMLLVALMPSFMRAAKAYAWTGAGFTHVLCLNGSSRLLSNDGLSRALDPSISHSEQFEACAYCSLLLDSPIVVTPASSPKTFALQAETQPCFVSQYLACTRDYLHPPATAPPENLSV